jgi:hypothetical protein
LFTSTATVSLGGDLDERLRAIDDFREFRL